MPGIECKRRQDRTDTLAEILFEVLLHLRCVVRRLDDGNFFVAQDRCERLVPAVGDFAQHHFGSGPHHREALTGGKAVGRGDLVARATLARERRDAHHEEFVEVVGGDRQKLHPLERGMGVGPGLRQHALVEGEPTELSVDIQGGI